MDLAVGLVPGLQVLAHVFRHQVAPVGRGVDQHVVARSRYRAVQHRFQRLVAGLAFLEGQVVAEHDVALVPAGDQFDDVGQVAQVGLVDLDQPQALAAVGGQHGLDQRTLAGAARAGHQHVVGRLLLQELPRVAVDDVLLALDVLQVVHVDARDVAHGIEPAARTALAPAVGMRGPVDVGRRGGQPGFQLRQHAFGPRQQADHVGGRRIHRDQER
ncbi:Uncharacterised protein [Bordetella ansorpii]|uniref:Uncharacterized protein n=1 Tax=Bordetella ansorpii TaxID=288768 RepID=A0A157SQR3_9BORD|nr:Uncharacterised protein [Bordetella ansorpii]